MDVIGSIPVGPTIKRSLYRHRDAGFLLSQSSQIQDARISAALAVERADNPL
ncbi:hypothetical protein [Arthrobacter psychrolactophilus]